MKNFIKKQQEKKLIEQLKKGDSKAVKKWFDMYQKILMRIALSKAKNAEDAQELVQEAFINCLRSLHLFKGKSSLFSWMQSILRHEIADYYRKLYAKKAIKTLPLSELFLSTPLSDAHETSVKVRQVLEKMVTDKKELLLLKYVDKKKVKEIAAKMGRTVKSVESDLFRARNEFRSLYLSFED